jgi:SHS2 domain-containing protein
MAYEVFPHTADVGLRVTASDLSSLFAEAGRGFYSLIVSNLPDVQLLTRIEFDIQGSDLAFLMVDWLNELLFTFESKRLLLRKFDVEVKANGLCASGQGEAVDESRHVLDHEIKAITYHGLRVERVNGDWIAEVILDI